MATSSGFKFLYLYLYGAVYVILLNLCGIQIQKIILVLTLKGDYIV